PVWARLPRSKSSEIVAPVARIHPPPTLGYLTEPQATGSGATGRREGKAAPGSCLRGLPRYSYKWLSLTLCPQTPDCGTSPPDTTAQTAWGGPPQARLVLSLARGWPPRHHAVRTRRGSVPPDQYSAGYFRRDW